MSLRRSGMHIEIKDVLEKKIEDLSRQLANEKQLHRKEKLHVTKLQRELTKVKADRSRSESRELQQRDAEQERILRLEAERKLHDMTVESKNTHSRLLTLQTEFKKMEEMVSSMMQYKTKIDQLKQEKSSLSVTYESNLHKCRQHISNLERENMMLMSDVRRFETQMDGQTDDRSKLLLERLKMLEAENSALVLENEQQRQQYEKCLDEIANQVVQALLAQKALREECVKLQKRVNDLEGQNQELCQMFRHKIRHHSDSGIQIPDPQFSSTVSNHDDAVHSNHDDAVNTQVDSALSEAMSFTQTMHLSPMSQYILQNTVAQKCLQQYLPESMESLQGIYTDYSLKGTSGHPQLSVLPPWIDKQEVQRSRSATSPSSMSPPTEEQNRCTRTQSTKIETEFPATPSSPKMKHVSVSERVKTRRSSSVSSLQGGTKVQGASSLGKSKNAQSLTSKSASNVAIQKTSQSSLKNLDQKSASQPDHMDKVLSVATEVSKSTVSSKSCSTTVGSGIPVKRTSKLLLQSNLPHTSSGALQTKVTKKNLIKSERNNSDTNLKGNTTHSTSRFATRDSSPRLSSGTASSQGKQLAKLNSVSKKSANTEQLESQNSPSAPLVPKAQYFYDYSDEDSDFNRPVSMDFRTTSTTSLNEILDGDDTDTLLDEEITAETFTLFNSSPVIRSSTLNNKDMKEDRKEKHRKVTKSSSLGSKPDIVKDTMNSERRSSETRTSELRSSEIRSHSKSPHMGRRKLSLTYQGKRKGQGQRPSSLVLSSREKQYSYNDEVSTSFSSTDSDENWSPQMERKFRPRHKANRKSSSSSNRSSYHSSVSDQQSHKSSQELTPVAMETKHLVMNELSQSAKSEKTVYIQQSSENLMGSEKSVDPGFSSKKGPPPPIPKKPMPGKKSPGIRMGIQSPGFRQNKPAQISHLVKDANAETGSILRPHEFKTDRGTPMDEGNKKCHISSMKIQLVSSSKTKVPKDINEGTNLVLSKSANQDASFDISNPANQEASLVISNPANHKYVSSDSSFEGKNLDKVERSGSKDDGYSTMSSDIQPEALEKFNDVSVSKADVFFPETVKCETSHAPSSPRNAISKIGHKSSPETVSDLDSIFVSSTPEGEMKSSSSTSSLSSVKSPKSPKLNPSEERAAKFGSLGRVRAMKMLFEADNQHSQESKFSKFPLRKSPSVDSSLSPRKPVENSARFKRHSLGDDIQLLPNTDTSKADALKMEISDNGETKQVENEVIVNEKKKFEPQQRPSLKPNIPDKPPSFQPLHLSEENFLSDIPEERDEGDISTHSSANHLDLSFRHQYHVTKRLEVLNMFKLSTKKTFWSSLQGLFRLSSRVEKCRTTKLTDKRCGKRWERPLERSMSFDDLDLFKEGGKQKISPHLHTTKGTIALDEFRVVERVQGIVKAHILQQLSLSADCESEDDLQHLSFCQLLENRKVKNMHHSRCQRHFQGHSSQFSSFHGSSSRGESPLLFSRETSVGLSSEERSMSRSRQESISSNDESLNQDLDARFRSDYYSLCTVESSKASSVDGDGEHVDQMHHTCKDAKNSCSRCISEKNTEEFEEISRQLASLSKTVSALHHSLSSLNSHDSETESNEDRSHVFAAPPRDFKDNEGYQWEEDEFYLTPCGGEIITGISPFSQTGACAEWVNEYIDDTSCNDEFEFYGHLPPTNENEAYDFKKLCTSIREGDPKTGSTIGTGEANAAMETASSNLIGQKSNLHGNKAFALEDSTVLDPKLRAAMLDSMVHLSGASMDSLDDNIGVDHVMCSRLIGRGEHPQGPIRGAVSRPTVDLSRFYTRFGESEKEAVAAFDFLNDISTSPDTSQQDIQPPCDQSEQGRQNQSETDQSQQRTQIQPDQSHSRSQIQTDQSQSSTQKQEKPKVECKNKSDKTKDLANKEKSVNYKIPTRTQGSMKVPIGRQSGKPDNQSKIPEAKRQHQGLDNSDTSKKGAQGLVSSISRFMHGKTSGGNVTNPKPSKAKAKEEKTNVSKLPRKFIPGKEKTIKPKVESKIPKPSKS